MKTIIVPTDFSETAYNAARYAIGLAEQTGASRIILYHAYELIVPIPDLPTAVPMVNMDDLKAASIEGLEKMKSLLSPALPASVTLDFRADNHLLAANIDQVCKDEQADLIIMGITGGSQLEEILVGSNTVDVVKNSNFPVIVVPTQASFRPIRKVVFACDLRKVAKTTRKDVLHMVLDIFKPELHVLNIQKEGREHIHPEENQELDNMLHNYNPQYHFVDHPNTVEGITAFAEKEAADLLLIIPKKHGLFDSIFKRSTTSRIAFNTHIPLLSIHE
ncbi:universal stress protein [Chitinophaga cymbidii]|uniref:Universal stress protein UspA n=1 Tax=Chitinophaga cymbidii TaxID=1096750 RepID=A0A512RGT5_9BACT|nr:universal stress protein [Chitinophaga cymbidii]GEP94884.1 universal stress protein UspA [Chitinophaga cymbidii]